MTLNLLDPFETLNQPLRELLLPREVRAAAVALDLHTLRDLAALDPSALKTRFALPPAAVREVSYLIRSRCQVPWRDVAAKTGPRPPPAEEAPLSALWSRLAATVPTELRTDPLRAIPDLDARLLNAARRLGVTTLGALVDRNAPSLLEVRNLGPGILAGAIAAITAYVADQAARDARARLDTYPDLVALWRARAEPLTAREHILLDRRAGLDGPAATIRDTAQFFGVCRERVRQMERRALSQMTRDDRWVTALDARIRRGLLGGARPVLALVADDPWLAALRDAPPFARYVFRHVLGNRYALLDQDEAAAVALTATPEPIPRAPV